MIINVACGSKSVCSIYNMAVNKVCPNDIFKRMFDNEKFFFLIPLIPLIPLITFCKKENSNAGACKLTLMRV